MKGLKSISLTVAMCLLIAVSIGAQTAYKISAPYTHKNLTIYLIHGADASNNKDLITLEEALKMKIFKVYETEDVNELIVENISDKYDVFISIRRYRERRQAGPRPCDKHHHSAQVRQGFDRGILR